MNMGLKKQAHIQVTLKIINEPKLPFYQHAQEKNYYILLMWQNDKK